MAVAQNLSKQASKQSYSFNYLKQVNYEFEYIIFADPSCPHLTNADRMGLFFYA